MSKPALSDFTLTLPCAASEFIQRILANTINCRRTAVIFAMILPLQLFYSYSILVTHCTRVGAVIPDANRGEVFYRIELLKILDKPPTPNLFKKMDFDGDKKISKKEVCVVGIYSIFIDKCGLEYPLTFV